MHETLIIEEQVFPRLKERLIEYAKNFEMACILDSNSDFFSQKSAFAFNNYDIIAGYSISYTNSIKITEFSDLDNLSKNNHDWYLGYLTYDLKNNFEKLQSDNPDFLEWTTLLFFKPEILILLKDRKLNITTNISSVQCIDILKSLTNISFGKQTPLNFNLMPRMLKNDYLDKINQIKQHISLGDIYEVNFCQEFYAHAKIDAYSTFRYINERSSAPFAAFIKLKNKYILSASPERFLKKENVSIISQPIKGTAPRGTDKEEDIHNTRILSLNHKEKSENIMIVDLVRNDLSKIAKRSTVKVEELCGIYSFPFVHQMISTISAELKTNSFCEIIRATFPMGSMTGAPKIAAMKIIEKYETIKRGLYSGSIGYISPSFDFDFNVVIRSLQYNAEKNYLSYMAGSAITALSDPEKEYEECLLKIYGINNTSHRIYYA